jgi:hypothetical protein
VRSTSQIRNPPSLSGEVLAAVQERGEPIRNPQFIRFTLICLDFTPTTLTWHAFPPTYEIRSLPGSAIRKAFAFFPAPSNNPGLIPLQ